jgi:hypothetical protein
VFLPKGAFGSPGGYPLPSTAVYPSKQAFPFPAHGHLRFRPHFGFTHPIGLYAPAVTYGLSPDPVPQAVTISPVIHVSPTVIVSQPALTQPVPVPAAPAEPSFSTVVEHSTGRYELRGDGVTTPHAWVWIPHPPSAPPSAAQPAAEQRASEPRVTVRTTAYRWTDEDGTTYVTNRLDRVPEQYRSPEAPLR